jgi:hypothetical protein
LARIGIGFLQFAPQPMRIKQFAANRFFSDGTPEGDGKKNFCAAPYAATLTYPARRSHFRFPIDKLFTSVTITPLTLVLAQLELRLASVMGTGK